jgi:hypothetical protein
MFLSLDEDFFLLCNLEHCLPYGLKLLPVKSGKPHECHIPNSHILATHNNNLFIGLKLNRKNHLTVCSMIMVLNYQEKTKKL